MGISPFKLQTVETKDNSIIVNFFYRRLKATDFRGIILITAFILIALLGPLYAYKLVTKNFAAILGLASFATVGVVIFTTKGKIYTAKIGFDELNEVRRVKTFEVFAIPNKETISDLKDFLDGKIERPRSYLLAGHKPPIGEAIVLKGPNVDYEMRVQNTPDEVDDVIRKFNEYKKLKK